VVSVNAMAEMHFGLESDPKMQESMKKTVEKAMEQGIDHVLEDASISPDAKKSLEAGKFKLTVSSHPKTHQDQVMVVPEGNVQEKIPLTQKLNDQLATQFKQSK
jgi:3-dehydroquinate synthase class II